MAALFRVFPYLKAASPDAPGGPLYIPPQGAGRIDNPASYSVLYLSNAAPGAVSEAFGRLPEWTSPMLQGSPSLPGSAHAIARYRLQKDALVCDLDDASQLRKLRLRPSDVVTRDYARSRAWAQVIYNQGPWSGVCWWSYYNSDWSSYGLWDASKLLLEDAQALRLDHPAVIEAARTIARRIVTRTP